LAAGLWGQTLQQSQNFAVFGLPGRTREDFMQNRRPPLSASTVIALRPALAVLLVLAAMGVNANAQNTIPLRRPGTIENQGILAPAPREREIPADVVALCVPTVTANKELVTPAQRKAAGAIAWPPLTDQADGFAWPDTELGVIKGDGGYVFFGSDGGFHSRQFWEGRYYGNNKYGSITRTIGTLDNPLGTEPPIDVTIHANPDPSVNPFYSSYDYMGGGPVYLVPPGMPGAGKLLMVYHAEIPTITTQSFYSVLALASSSDGGMDWTDLGEIVRLNQGYRSDMDGYDIGDANLVVSPDGKYFYIYFSDWLANGTTHWGNTITVLSVARATIESVLNDAFGEHPRAAAFQKHYEGWHLDQGLGGYSGDLNPTGGYNGNQQVAYNSYLKRYQMFINQGVLIAYSESPDAMHWSQPTVLHDFRQDPGTPSVYDVPVGMGDDPSILGKQFYILYTRSPNGLGWSGASVDRFTVSCQ
jgi:hypothetical protein